MKIFALISVIIILLAIVGVTVFGFVLPKQRRGETEQLSVCESLFKEGKYQDAIPLLESFVKEHSRGERSSDAIYYLAKSRQEVGDYQKASELWVKIAKDQSKYAAEAYYYLGLNYERDNQIDHALESYKMVAERSSDNPVAAGALVGIGRISEANKDKQGAIASYQKVLDTYANTSFASEAEERLGSINMENFFEQNAVSYAVQRGDSLVTIARKFKITPALIMRINGLKNNAVSVGQTIEVINGNDFNILIDISDCKLSLKSGEKLVKIYQVCVGKKETPTPKGSYRITDKAIDPVWFSGASTGNKGVIPGGDPRNELGTRWIGFKPAYGIHGTIFPESIGKPESHGCVRMQIKDVEELYDIVGKGTPVKIIE